MKPSILAQLLKRGITPQHPRFNIEATRLQEQQENEQQLLRKTAVTAGFTRVLHLKDWYEIEVWLRNEGRSIRLGRVQELEIWERGENRLLAVKNPDWTVYQIQKIENQYRCHRRLV